MTQRKRLTPEELLTFIKRLMINAQKAGNHARVREFATQLVAVELACKERAQKQNTTEQDKTDDVDPI